MLPVRLDFFMGAAAGVRYQVHLGIDLMDKLLSLRAYRYVVVLVNLIIQFQEYPSMNISMQYPYMAVPVGGISMLINSLRVMVAGELMESGGISGAATEETAAVRAVSIPAMIRKGNHKGFAAAVQAAGGSIGVIMVTALAIGMLTPQLGICLFISCNIAQIPLTEILKYNFPFLLVMIGVLVLMTYVPAIVMIIPNLYGG
jgi:TRAP-type C4-dicarboxylate transport system permease large subunit